MTRRDVCLADSAHFRRRWLRDASLHKDARDHHPVAVFFAHFAAARHDENTSNEYPHRCQHQAQQQGDAHAVHGLRRLGSALHKHAAAIRAGDFITRIMVNMEVDLRVAKRPAAAIAGDFLGADFDGFKHNALIREDKLWTR